ncbi:MAG: Cof-type HAD-IIB family hydrolase [Atopobiaceae bacterium]|nr:Cof-type HAD-IIB family hydrolase [Atopobiaceae bacterium]
MAPYKLLALDMDGTLLNSQKEVSPRTAEAIAQLAARDIPIAFCTGRNVAELGPYLDALTFVRYGVLVSGALVRDFSTGDIVASYPHDTQTVLKVVEAGQIEDAMVHILAVEESLITIRDMGRLDDVHMDVYRPLYESCARHVDDIREAVLAHEGEMLKVNLYHLSPESRARSRARLQDLPLTLADAETTSLECSPLGVSKARGLAALCAHVGCTLDEVVMVGDAENDLEVLRAVGMPVAMGNAVPEVKRVARLQVADCDHDGIAEAVNRLFP